MSTCNILMYSHDTYGLGHIRRTMAIASHLVGPDTNIIILTGSPIVGQFALPDQIDFVRIPGMIKKTNEEYLPLSIRINPKHALDIRKNIIKTTAKTFQPSLFIVDKEPLGLKKEVLPTLKWLNRSLPGTRTILGLRDVMDEGSVVMKDWEEKGVYKTLDRLYHEIWVYGMQELYDPVTEYRIPASVSRKMVFTGYIQRKVPSVSRVKRFLRKNCVRDESKLVAVTVGGGGDGYAVIDAYLTMLETHPSPSFKSVIITGPFMPECEREKVSARSRCLGVKTWHYYPRMEEILAAADLVVGMGGYNTICEILTQGTLALIVPRDTPRREQLIRARMLHQKKLVDYLPWRHLSPDNLYDKITGLLASPHEYHRAIAQFPLTGLDVMSRRIESLVSNRKEK